MAKKKNDAVNPDFADMENPTFFESVDDMNESGLVDDGIIYSDSGDSLADNEPGWEPYDAPEGENKKSDSSALPTNDKDGVSVPGEELVELVIAFDHTTGAQQVKFSINLKEFVIPVGEPVMVPKYVRDYWVSMSKQKFEFDRQRRAFESNDE